MLTSEYNYNPPEKYSSFKKRKINEYEEKFKKVLKGIEEVSLKQNDKDFLRKKLLGILNETIVRETTKE